jgi:hypothetical protein
MITQTQFMTKTLKSKQSLLKKCFKILSKHYDYFKDLYEYLIKNSDIVDENFLDTSYYIVFKLYEKLEK